MPKPAIRECRNKGIELKIRRLRIGLKQYELAAKIGIAQTQLSEIETGRRQPSPELRQRILQATKGNQNGQ
jgi:transcriptional regulator with XRE-family HTH domain